MKKTLSVLVLLLFTLSVFFCVPVFASQTTFNFVQRFTANKTDSTTGIQMSAVVDECYPESYSAMTQGSIAEILVSLKLYNPSTLPGFIYLPTIQFNFSSNTSYQRAEVTDIDNLSPDLFLGDNINAGGSNINILRIYSSADYTRGDGVVIPPGSSLYMVASVSVACYYDVSVQNIKIPVIDSVSLNGGAFALSADYQYAGKPVDLSHIESLLSSIDQNTSDIESIINSIKNELIPNANIYIPSSNPTQYFTKTLSTGLQYFYSFLACYTNQAYIGVDSIDHFDEYHTVERIIPIVINFQLENYYDYAVAQTGAATNTAFVISDLLPDSPDISYEIGSYDSNVFNIPRIAQLGNQYALLVFDYKMCTNVINGVSGSYCGLIPKGSNHGTFTILAHIRGSNQFQLNSNFTISNTYTFDQTDIYLKAEGLMLSDIYNALNSSNSDNVSNDSDTLHDQSEQAHSQEMAYYNSNTQAIQNTGLQSYRFSNDQEIGIGAVRNDFIALWNSLGGWTTVYIFSLTLGLALTILRHTPSAISSAVRRRRDSRE